jgi:death-on-curing protein
MNPKFLDLAKVLEIQQSCIELYGGAYGIRDIGLLESALAQPLAGFSGEYFHADVFEMAGAYLFHLSRNHPFIDGNKRTALASALIFLEYNSIEINAEFDDLEELTLKVAQGQMNKEQTAKFLRDCSKLNQE